MCRNAKGTMKIVEIQLKKKIGTQFCMNHLRTLPRPIKTVALFWHHLILQLVGASFAFFCYFSSLFIQLAP